jgi:phospholipid/cholesterol/gamma-HCH transport system substrate-binding protein
MERNAHYAAVGLATLVLLLGLVLFTIWLARFQLAQEFDEYDVLFFGPVRGLTEGGEVHFNGIKVGEVTDLSLDPSSPDRVIARVRVENAVPVRVDSRAQLEPLGITGVNYIQITAGNPRSPLLKTGRPDDEVPILLSQPSPITELLEGGGTVLARAVDTLNRVNRVLSDENIRSFSATLDNVEEVSAELNRRKQVLAEVEATVVAARSAVAEYEALARSGRVLVEGDGQQAVARLSSSANEIEAAARDAREIVGELKGPTTQFANTGLPQLTSAVQSLQEATESLNRLVEEARQSPQALVGRAPAREVEVPQ